MVLTLKERVCVCVVYIGILMKYIGTSYILTSHMYYATNLQGIVVLFFVYSFYLSDLINLFVYNRNSYNE